MRLRSLLGITLFVGVLAWAVYTALAVSADYYRMVELVETVVQTTARREIASVRVGNEPRDRSQEIRASILLEAARNGVTLDDRQVLVTRKPDGVAVKLKWTHALMTIDRDPIVAFPLTVDRAFEFARQ